MTNRPIMIGIGGGTGTGKTTAARFLCERFAPVGVALLDQDAYYLDRSQLAMDERSTINYDEPAAIDHDLLLRHAMELLHGASIQKPRYCYATHTRTETAEIVAPAPIVIVEGLFALWDSRLRDLMALKVYLDADADIRFIRRAQRDMAHRGRTIDSVITQYLQTVRPMHRKYIEPTMLEADLVLDASPAKLAELARRVDLLLSTDSRP